MLSKISTQAELAGAETAWDVGGDPVGQVCQLAELFVEVGSASLPSTLAELVMQAVNGFGAFPVIAIVTDALTASA